MDNSSLRYHKRAKLIGIVNLILILCVVLPCLIYDIHMRVTTTPDKLSGWKKALIVLSAVYITLMVIVNSIYVYSTFKWTKDTMLALKVAKMFRGETTSLLYIYIFVLARRLFFSEEVLTTAEIWMLSVLGVFAFFQLVFHYVMRRYILQMWEAMRVP